MRKLSEETLKKIQDKASELMDLIRAENCRIIAHSDHTDWSTDLKVVPCELEMGDRGVEDENGEEADSIDTGELQSLGLYGVILDTEVNSMYEEGQCAEPVNLD